MAFGGDFDYDRAGHGYAQKRRADHRIAARVHAALGAARTVINVGAGAGSYEPADRYVIPVEPSAAMRAQRRSPAPPAIIGYAEQLPFDENTFDAAMATITVHQWSDPVRGVAEMRRVSRGPVVILTLDEQRLSRFWLGDYFPELIATEARRFPPIDVLADAVGGSVTVERVPVPLDCVDGFAEAYYARPAAFLDPLVRAAQSAWAFVAEDLIQRGLERLRTDLSTGEWERKYGDFLQQPAYEGSLTLVRGVPHSRSRRVEQPRGQL